MIVLDSSAVVAMILREAGADRITQGLAGAPAEERLMSVANYVEAGTVLAGRHRKPSEGVADLDHFLDEFGITLVAVDLDQARLAMRARIQFGRGFGAAAKLNFGDCFAYALAKARDAPLLYVGNDFANTDVVPAIAAIG
ncbi:MAG: type II toxin-antitoxin system VapC family toxin [Caulobacteraceae bacterium]|nr:type II toxin-antitoxin system VapC family toxin [Caulobacteraceae bacterium]